MYYHSQCMGTARVIFINDFLVCTFGVYIINCVKCKIYQIL